MVRPGHNGNDSEKPVLFARVSKRPVGQTPNQTIASLKCQIIEKMVEPWADELVDLYFHKPNRCFPVLDERSFRDQYRHQRDQISPALLAHVDWDIAESEKRLRIDIWWALVVHDKWFSLALSEVLDVYLVHLHDLRSSRRATSSFDPEVVLSRWEESLSGDARRLILRGTDLNIPGASNLRLSYLFVRLLQRRIELDNGRQNGDQTDTIFLSNRYVQIRRAAEDIVLLVQELQSPQLNDFWLPTAAFIFTSTIAFLLRVALETEETAGGLAESLSLRLAKDLLAALQAHQQHSHWELGDICIAQYAEVVEKLAVSSVCQQVPEVPAPDFQDFVIANLPDAQELFPNLRFRGLIIVPHFSVATFPERHRELPPSAQIIPGGFLTQPEPASNPLLDVQIATRHSIYVGNESIAELIVDAGLSHYHGFAYSTAVSTRSNETDSLHFTVTAKGSVLVSGTVSVNTTDNLFEFNLAGLEPSTSAYAVTLTGTTSSGWNYTAQSELFYLPDKTTGSVVKVDRLYGSLLYRNSATSGVFTPVFPYGYYGDYGGFFNETDNIVAFKQAGFNALNPVTDFADGNMTYSIDEMDQLNLLFQYDLRNSFQNITSVAEQIPLVKDHPSLLTYYTADEPDGWGYTFNSSKDAYNLLASLDKYHPTALVLNCQNYYFKEYSAGADIIMEDVYPIGINATYSKKWDTPVNLTYGDSGCDNCIGSPLDVPARVDDYHKYASWIGGSAVTRKPVWAVPQAFSGEQYWARDPTAEEAWVMDMLAFNHGAKARLAWIYPPSDVLSNAAARLANVVTVSPVVDFLTGA
ncbi:hypothetical protein VMCG_03939 [Cytospora schulzeri]|uniref:Uncharacterized protein n=1 Tax=Cytospora schulzeri TaxID=448051 RepID=A0A423WVF5_9PEZI|nr:hypothetical protein VMCG_03939 [Valsa malicola]